MIKKNKAEGKSKRAQIIKRRLVSLVGTKSIRVLVRSRKALSPVISNLILIAVVIVLGFAALAYARDISINYQTQYQQNVSSDIDKLKETIAFEYVYYDSGNLHVYFMNAGSNNIIVEKFYLSTSSVNYEYTIKNMDDSSVPNHDLGAGGERQIILQHTLSSGSYSVKITTVRGSSFAYNFAV
jgi:flagellin-like protein